MKITFLSLFPEMIEAVLKTSIMGRALNAGIFQLETIQIRDYAINEYGKVDDACYGGGSGMLLLAEPLYLAWCAATGSDPKSAALEQEGRLTVHLSPGGRPFTQQTAVQLATTVDHLIFICGHYEGIDQRVIEKIADCEISLGDYVISGGELAACVVADAVLRLVPGVLPQPEAYLCESHMEQLLEHAHYTRPASWRGHDVPPVLLSGHEARIKQWQRADSLRRTLIQRPDLIKDLKLDEETWRLLIENWRAEENR